MAEVTPETIDALVAEYDFLRDARNEAQLRLSSLEQILIALVEKSGTPVAMKSRRLIGATGSEITVSQGDVTSVITERVEALKIALAANGKAEEFDKLFKPRLTYEVVREPGVADLKMPRRLFGRVSRMFREAIQIKTKKPTLKVTVRERRAA